MKDHYTINKLNQLSKKHLIDFLKSFGVNVSNKISKNEIIALILAEKIRNVNIKIKLFIKNDYDCAEFQRAIEQRRRKISATFILTLIATLIAFLQFFNVKAPEIISAGNNEVIIPHGDSSFLDVLILPFSIDKECTIEESDISGKLVKFMQEKRSKENLQLAVHYYDPDTCLISDNDALKLANNLQMDIVIWGYYDEECDEIDKVRIKYAIMDKNIESNFYNGDSGYQEIEYSTQLLYGYLQNDIYYNIYWILAVYNLWNSNYKESYRMISAIDTSKPKIDQEKSRDWRKYPHQDLIFYYKDSIPNENAFLLKALCKYALENRVEAYRMFNELSRQYPKNYYYYYGRAILADGNYQNGDYGTDNIWDYKIKLLENSISLQETPAAYFQLGIVYFQYYGIARRNFKPALDKFEKATHLNKINPNYYYWMAICQYYNGQIVDALNSLEYSLALKPGYKLALDAKNRILNREGKIEWEYHTDLFSFGCFRK